MKSWSTDNCGQFQSAILIELLAASSSTTLPRVHQATQPSYDKSHFRATLSKKGGEVGFD